MPKQEQQQFLSFVERVKHGSPSESRKLFLASAAEECVKLSTTATMNLLCVCTHNSRRSQFSQFWSGYFAFQLGLESVHSYSCGTEATECNPRTLAALSRAGVQIETENSATNPKSMCSLDGYQVELFSKTFGAPSLPQSSIIALMCCDDVDQKCPTVPGAIYRVPLHYQDPKFSDGSEQEQAAYDKANLSIAIEMCFFVQDIAKKSSTAVDPPSPGY